MNHSKFGISADDVRLAASSDNTEGLTHYSAIRQVERKYATPLEYLQAKCPNSFRYLCERDIVSYNPLVDEATEEKATDKSLMKDIASHKFLTSMISPEHRLGITIDLDKMTNSKSSKTLKAFLRYLDDLYDRMHMSDTANIIKKGLML